MARKKADKASPLDAIVAVVNANASTAERNDTTLAQSLNGAYDRTDLLAKKHNELVTRTAEGIAAVQEFIDAADDRADSIEQHANQLARAINILHDRFEAHVAPKPSLWERVKARFAWASIW